MTNFLIEHQCPQCGAPAILEETDRIFACEYCRVKSYLFGQDYFRYMFPHAAPQDKEVLFFPYWRFKGMRFSCFPDRTDYRFTDISYPAADAGYFPLSLGLRSQTLKLRFVSPYPILAGGSRFLLPTLPAPQAMRFAQASSDLFLSDDSLVMSSFVGESVSMIYAPFCVDKTQNTAHRSPLTSHPSLIDAVLNEAIPIELPIDFDVSQIPGGIPDWQIRFMSMLCPDCGWDLKGERNALALYCNNCHSMWKAHRNGFEKLPTAYLSDFGIDSGTDIMYFPFWRIKADISGVKLNCYSDMVRIANLPRVIKNNRNETEFYFWAPSFMLRPQMFLNLGRNMTLFQPQEKLIPTLPDARCYPVTLPVTEAVESLKICLASFIKPRKNLSEKLQNIAVSPRKFLLVYVPFNETHQEFVNTELHIGINKNMLATTLPDKKS